MEKVSEYKEQKRTKLTNNKPEIKKKQRKKERKTKKHTRTARNRCKTDKEKAVICRVGSELSFVPASLCHYIRQDEDFRVGDFDGVIHWDVRFGKRHPSSYLLKLSYAS